MTRNEMLIYLNQPAFVGLALPSTGKATLYNLLYISERWNRGSDPLFLHESGCMRRNSQPEF